MLDGVIVAVKEENSDLEKSIRATYGVSPLQISNNDASGICSKYNLGISTILKQQLNPDGWIIFSHDDAILKSNDLKEQLAYIATKGAHIVGVAGNVQIPRLDPGYWWDGLTTSNFRGSGAVIHRTPNSENTFHIESYGPYPQQISAFDGVWFAVQTSQFAKFPELRFESSFPGYHFYDVDFCATARSLGLNIWVAGILVLHDKWGKGVEDPSFAEHQQLFIDKWSKKKHLYYKGQPKPSANNFIKGTTAFRLEN